MVCSSMEPAPSAVTRALQGLSAWPFVGGLTLSFSQVTLPKKKGTILSCFKSSSLSSFTRTVVQGVSCAVLVETNPRLFVLGVPFPEVTVTPSTKEAYRSGRG